MNKNTNFIKDEILSDVGEVIISDTQKLRVLIVKDGTTGETLVSAQKWWRKDEGKEWAIGKGFKLKGAESFMLGKLLTEVGLKMHMGN